MFFVQYALYVFILAITIACFIAIDWKLLKAETAVLCTCLEHGTREVCSVKTSEDLPGKEEYKKPF